MEYTNETLEALEIDSKTLEAAVFEDCLFKDCKITDCALVRCRFSGCRFVGCKFTGLTFKNTHAMYNSFEDCRISGVDWAALSDPRKSEMGFLPFDSLENCSLRHCNFYGFDLRKFNFSSCDLSGSFFDDCRLSEADFSNSRLEGASFSHNDLTGADFRGAMGYSFSVESNKVQKARFSLPEAVALLEGLGIVLEEA